MYNPKSLKAEEFINHEEILDTLKFAEENKTNRELIKSIIEKANFYSSRLFTRLPRVSIWTS